MSPETLLTSTCGAMLRTLSGWLDKAEAWAGDGADALMAERLAPDMFPLATQIRFACVQAREGMCRLAGQDFPADLTALLNEARNAGEQPGTIADARARIAETLERIAAFADAPAQSDPERPIVHALPIGIVFDLNAGQYARDWVLGQFYFHLMIAYAILRAKGVPLGKGDYVAHMMPFVRPGTMPQMPPGA
jgi:hypothetical protein